MSNISTYVIHYSRLTNRRVFLDKALKVNQISAEWVTENDFEPVKTSSIDSVKILGVSQKVLGMYLGVNSRSLVYTRRKARIQGYVLFIRSFISKKNNTYTTGSLPERVGLPVAVQEVKYMHITAIRKGINSSTNWILVLEDDAVPTKGAFDLVSRITETIKPTNTWINLNSGAGLKWTKSDPVPDGFGLYKVVPAATRCVAAYLISRDLAIKIIELIDKYGLPEWLPIDFILQAALRKTKARTFWQEPVSFLQGSEEGHYKSSLEGKRG